MKDEYRLLKKLNNEGVHLPKKGAELIVRIMLKLSILTHPHKYIFHLDKKTYKKKQVIILGTHVSRDDFYYVLDGYNLVAPNVVVGHQNLFSKGIFNLFLKCGVISKNLYEPDLAATKKMMQILRMGGSLCIFPEGIQSTTGVMHPINPATVKFLKKAGVDIILAKSYGTYMVRPRYNSHHLKGHQETHFEVLATKEELEQLSEEQLYDRLFNKFYYHEYKWNSIHHYHYKGRGIAEGLEKILFYCPNCKKSFKLHTKGDLVSCNCGAVVRLDDEYRFNTIFGNNNYKNIDEWFKAQRRLVQEEVKDPAFKVSYEVSLIDIYYDKLRKSRDHYIGEGLLTICRDGMHYVGTSRGEEVSLDFDIKAMPSFSFTPGINNEFYYHGKYYCFEPKEDKLKVSLYMLYIEELHNLVDPVWAKACDDAYFRKDE